MLVTCGKLCIRAPRGRNYESDIALTGMIDCANRIITVEAKYLTGSFSLTGRGYRRRKLTFLEGAHHQTDTIWLKMY